MYPLRQHKNLTTGKWFAYPKVRQVLMISNELNRAKNWIRKQENASVDACYERALELTDLTTADDKWQGNARREMRRFRETLAGLYVDPDMDTVLNDRLYRCLLQMVPEAWNLLNRDRATNGVDTK